MAEEPELVTVGQFSGPLEAEMAQGRLDSAGIPSFLTGENTARLYGTGLGGLQLQVSAEDEADARRLLEAPDEEALAAEALAAAKEDTKNPRKR